MPTEEEVHEKLEQVIDPELGINIVDLGLVYEIDAEEGDIHVLMTLTTPGCPLHDVFREEVKKNVSELEGLEGEDIEVELTFDPPWSREDMSDEARAELDFI
ncbi:MAG: metal-sulfur cluster assembly factor [Candidatus Nanohaloarchaeota archaeon QJJ-7]|nr:metal-sulfur cluster assembly factor [Candidatus Nanohaloarchaeota archaeon QJJ-7]